MRKSGFLLFLLLMLAALSVSYFGLSMMAQEAEPLLLLSRYNEATELSELYVLNAVTGEEQLITDLTGLSDAGWSPDGRVWVVEDTTEGERRLRFFDGQTGEESPGVEGIYADACFPAVYWSPNGEQLTYISNTGDEFFLNVQNLHGNSPYQLPVEQYERPFWSPDSQYLYIGVTYDYRPSPLVSAASGAILSEINSFISFSPDSRYISYWDSGNKLHLYEIATGESIALGDSQFGLWSASGRYFMSQTYARSESLSYYDTQSQSLQSIDLGFQASFVSWSADESAILLYTQFFDYSGEERSTKLFRYDMATGEMTSILEDVAWIGSVSQNGDWLAVRYSLFPPEDHFSPTTKLLMMNSEGFQTFDLVVGDGWFRSSISSLPNEHGFLIDAEDGLYHFDTQAGSLEPIVLENTGYSLWTADGAYIAFVSVNMPENPNTLNIWSMEGKRMSLSLEVEGHPTIIGWQGSDLAESLLYCGEG